MIKKKIYFIFFIFFISISTCFAFWPLIPAIAGVGGRIMMPTIAKQGLKMGLNTAIVRNGISQLGTKLAAQAGRGKFISAMGMVTLVGGATSVVYEGVDFSMNGEDLKISYSEPDADFPPLPPTSQGLVYAPEYVFNDADIGKIIILKGGPISSTAVPRYYTPRIVTGVTGTNQIPNQLPEFEDRTQKANTERIIVDGQTIGFKVLYWIDHVPSTGSQKTSTYPLNPTQADFDNLPKYIKDLPMSDASAASIVDSVHEGLCTDGDCILPWVPSKPITGDMVESVISSNGVIPSNIVGQGQLQLGDFLKPIDSSKVFDNSLVNDDFVYQDLPNEGGNEGGNTVVNVNTCGAYGNPACSVDDSGFKDVNIDDSSALDSLDSFNQGILSQMAEFMPDIPTWDWLLPISPKVCQPLDFPVLGISLKVNLCPYLPMLHQAINFLAYIFTALQLFKLCFPGRENNN